MSMAAAERSLSAILDDIALKIMMVEPGDLSLIGELLELADECINSDKCKTESVPAEMARALKSVLEQLIMGEVSDSPESYEHLGQCVSLMQEVERSGGEDESLTGKFCDHLQQTGFQFDSGTFSASAADQSVTSDDEAVDTRFLQDRELLQGFIEESLEHMENIENLILELEKNPDDPEIVNAVFRAFHTIKGTSALVDLETINKLAHRTENLLDAVRAGRRKIDSSVTDIVLKVGDYLKSMILNVRDVAENGLDLYKRFDISALIKQVDRVESGETVTEGGDEEPSPAEEISLGEGEVPDFMQDPELLGGFISEAYEHLESIEVHVLELEQDPDDLDIINNIFRPFHTIKGVSGFLNLKTINTLAHTTENLLDDVRNGIRPMSTEIIDVVLDVGDQLRSMVENISDVLEQGQGAYQPFDISDFIGRIKALREEKESPAAAPPPVEEQTAGEPESAVEPPVEAPVVVSSPMAPQPPKDTASNNRKVKVQAEIKVNVEKLDSLVNAVGELVIMQAMVHQNPLIRDIGEPKLIKDLSQLSRITTELQKTAMSMRMVPIRQTFQKMTRLVRDLSKKTGKEVDLIVRGEETEIDRNMVDSIYDPLVHMMRNSVDHGIQVPGERRKNGKPEKGSVTLSAYQKGGNIVIDIQDDGEGVATDKIRRKALARGLITEKDSLTDHEVNNLIFLPGFSTADKITDVSGRGVGMDVVKKGVEKLRGTVELHSTPGEGSQFMMRLPLTLAIIDGIIVRVGSERYIIPTVAIQESLRPKQENYNTVHGRGEALLIRDLLVPIIRLNRLFGVDADCSDPCEGIVVVVENEGRRRALLVDELLGKQEVVIKSLGGYMKDIKGLAGGTILADGRVGLILDLAGVIGASEEMGMAGLPDKTGD